ncbi:ABC transporter substrate-binding protein [Amphritea japonica]|uniref:NitT/TauT family transport system substrate-binding protein n=1 Tax=Amphritea japonica ATCC BAA-1530 TaxID=1278309 RepID=A0A7R6STX5_9GAMM|nr:ABC transporter substrate-binding protein [Amphritea japonica]BBB27165.1 NitT/TauT family transport system substrate-binding protein [Amphritea japonica ATCC BAA-1530]
MLAMILNGLLALSPRVKFKAMIVALSSAAALSWVTPVLASPVPTVRVAVLQFGTVNWEMDVIRRHELDKKYHFSLDVTPVGGKNASAISLQSGAVDIIYSDWVWVNRQRFNDRMFGFSPVSAAAGGLYAQSNSSVGSIKDLEGQRLGIAGGSVDKSWLLLQAYTKQTLDQDLAQSVEPVFAAPPLLNQLMYDNKLPLILNFWHYSARLKAKGFRQIISVQEMMNGLGVNRQVPLVGWVFTEAWRQENNALLSNFLKASRDAREILLNSDREWQQIRPLTRAEDDQIFAALKEGYRAGVQQQFGMDELDALEKLYAIMAREGGDELTGGANTLDRSLFWLPDAEEGVIQIGVN